MYSYSLEGQNELLQFLKAPTVGLWDRSFLKVPL